MSEIDHELCRYLLRDEAVRAAEDAAAVPAIQHRDLPEAVAALTERVAELTTKHNALADLARLDAGWLKANEQRLTAERDAARARVAELEAALVADSATTQPPPRGWLTAEEREASTEAMKCMTKLRRERDEANAECERLRVAHLKAVLERDRANEARGRIRSEWTRRGQALHAAQQAIGALNARVAELEAAAPPRSWLTAEEREAVEMFIRMGDEHDDVDAECAAMKLRALLARSTPPRVRRPNPNVVITTVDARERIDRQWIAAIRAAGGEVCE